jgi:hypothetical protein
METEKDRVPREKDMVSEGGLLGRGGPGLLAVFGYQVWRPTGYVLAIPA